MVGIGPAQVFGILQTVLSGHIAIERIVGTGLVGDHIGYNPLIDKFRQDFGGIAQHTDRAGPTIAFGFDGLVDGGIHVFVPLVEITGFDPAFDSFAVDLDTEGHATIHFDRQGLSAAHASETGGHTETAFEAAVKVFFGHGPEGFVGALQNALGANIYPAARGHLAVHHQAQRFQFAEFFPGRPMGHQIGIGNQDTGRVGVGFKHTHRFA